MLDSQRLSRIVRHIGFVRLGAGIALGAAPRTFLSWERDTPAGSSMDLLMRTVGIRDVALGLGTVRALGDGSLEDVERWLQAGLLSDCLDVIAGLVAARTTGRRGLVSALVAAPVVVADAWALNLLRNRSGAG